MACNNCNDGCGGSTTTNKLLSKEGLQHILDTLSGKLFTVLGTSMRIEVSDSTVLFTGTTLRKTVAITAYKGGKKIDIEAILPIAIPTDAGYTVDADIEDGVLEVFVMRSYALSAINDSFTVSFTIDGTEYREVISVTSADPSINVLQGFVNPLYKNTQMEADLWTFDGSVPTVRFVRDGSYWINLPTRWAAYFGDFDISRMNVHVSMGGQNVGYQVFCGRYSPGESYGEDTASTDCWAAVLVLMRDGDSNRVNDTFFITVSYVPAITECYAEKEEQTATESVEYDTPTASLSYEAISLTGGTTYADYAYSQAWTMDGVSQTPLTTGATVRFETGNILASDYYDISINEKTGTVTVTPNGSGVIPVGEVEICTVTMTVTMNGKTCNVAATVVARDATAGGVTTTEYDAPVVALSYPNMANGGGEITPALGYSQSWRSDGVSQTPITTGGSVAYSLVETLATEYYEVAVDATTGVITATPTGNTTSVSSIDLCSVKAVVTLNGVSGEATATVIVSGSMDSGMTPD